MGILGILAVIAFQAADTVVTPVGPLPAWGSGARLVEVVRVGSLDGPEHSILGRISGAAIGPEGTMIVSDVQVPAIREYSPDGRWVRDIGRRGQGPGEYTLIYGVKQLADGPLTILDPRNARVTRYQDGEYSSSFPSLSGLHASDLLAVDTAGHTYVKTVIRNPMEPVSSGPGEEWRKGWIRFDPDGTVVDTVAIPMENIEGRSFVLSGKGGYFRPFSTMTLSILSPHGYLVSARNDDYALHYTLRDGRVRRLSREVEPIAVTPEERRQWEAWVDRFEDRAREQGNRGSYGPIPRSKPFIRNIFVDDDGRIWVAVYAEARFKPYTEAQKAERGDRPSLEWNQPLVWEVISAEGVLLGRLTLPDGTDLLAARGNIVLGSQAGEFDEDYLVRFRIEGRAQGN